MVNTFEGSIFQRAVLGVLYDRKYSYAIDNYINGCKQHLTLVLLINFTQSRKCNNATTMSAACREPLCSGGVTDFWDTLKELFNKQITFYVNKWASDQL